MDWLISGYAWPVSFSIAKKLIKHFHGITLLGFLYRDIDSYSSVIIVPDTDKSPIQGNNTLSHDWLETENISVRTVAHTA